MLNSPSSYRSASPVSAPALPASRSQASSAHSPLSAFPQDPHRRKQENFGPSHWLGPRSGTSLRPVPPFQTSHHPCRSSSVLPADTPFSKESNPSHRHSGYV